MHTHLGKPGTEALCHLGCAGKAGHPAEGVAMPLEVQDPVTRGARQPRLHHVHFPLVRARRLRAIQGIQDGVAF